MRTWIKFSGFALAGIILLFAAQTVHATSLVAGYLQIGPIEYRGEPVTPTLTVENDSNFNAFSNEWDTRFRIYSGLQLLYDETVQGKDLAPYTETQITPTVSFTPDWLGEFRVTASISYLYEVAPEDNDTETTFTSILTPEDAQTIYLGEFSKYCTGEPNALGFMPQMVLEPGDSLKSEDVEEFAIELDSYKYMAMLDCTPLARLNHPKMVFTLDATDETDIETYEIDESLYVNGSPYLSGLGAKMLTTDLIFGTLPEPESIPNDNTVTDDATTQVTGDSICAILVTGKTDDAFEQSAFDLDVEFMSKNLMFESLGVRLPESSIRVLKEPSSQEIRILLNSMRGNYKTIYFYYSGHGWKGGMTTNDDIFNRLSYWDLGYDLWDTGAQNIHVIVDACYSGTAVQAFKAREDNWDGKNVTVHSASSADTTSRFKYLHTDANGTDFFAGRFTWAFVQCYGDPTADTDGTYAWHLS